jgi:hypothetical protein
LETALTNQDSNTEDYILPLILYEYKNKSLTLRDGHGVTVFGGGTECWGKYLKSREGKYEEEEEAVKSVFSGNQLCQCGVGVWYFRDCLCSSSGVECHIHTKL